MSNKEAFIEKVSNGYICFIKDSIGQKKVFLIFDELIQELAFHFDEKGIGEKWETMFNLGSDSEVTRVRVVKE